MQTVVIGNLNIIKVPVQDREPYHKVLFDIVDELRIPTIDAVATIRAMITSGELLESEGQGMIMLLNSRTIKPDPYQITKSKLQDIYTDPQNYADARLEGSILTALAEEELAILGGPNVKLVKDAEFRGRRRKQNETTNQQQTKRNERHR